MLTAHPPKVSVLLPVYNGEQFLRPSIESILNQSYGDFEVLILDDGSRDGSLDVVAGFADPRIRVIRNERNLGLIRTLNLGLAEARGTYIARQDADDCALRERFAKQVRVLDENPAAVLVGSWLQLIDEQDRPLTVWRYPAEPLAVEWALHFDSAAGHSSVMYRADTARTLGGYPLDYPHAEDFALWSRMTEAGELRNLPEVLELYRVHAAAVSRTARDGQLDSRSRIARGNMERTLGRPVPESAMPLFHDKTLASEADVIRAIDALTELANAFLTRRQPTGAARAEIEENLLERIGSRLSQLPPGARVRAMVHAWGRLPSRTLLSPRWPALFVGRRFKARLQSLAGRGASS